VLLPFPHHFGRQSGSDSRNGGKVGGGGLVEVHGAAQEDEFKPREGTRTPRIPAAADPVPRRHPAPFRLASPWSPGRKTPQCSRRHAGQEQGRKGQAVDHAFGPSKPCAIAPRGWESLRKHASFLGPER
jgi:hypothetical protein